MIKTVLLTTSKMTIKNKKAKNLKRKDPNTQKVDQETKIMDKIKKTMPIATKIKNLDMPNHLALT